MKHSFYLFAIFLVTVRQPAAAQSSREHAEAHALYQQANAAPGQALRTAISQQVAGFMGQGAFQFGTLRTYEGRNLLVPGLRYHPGLHVLEVQDSINTDATHLWPVGSLRGFDLGEADDPDSPLRRFRTRLVKEGTEGTRREFVEVLTAIDAGPLLLAWLYTAGPEAGSGRRPLVGVLLAGSGTDNSEPLRPLEANEAAVTRLFGARTAAVRAFATKERLDYTRPTDIARMMDHYNRIAVVK